MRATAVGFEQMPGVKASLDAYNGVSASREQMDPTRYLGFVRNVVDALRYVTEARNYKSALSTSNAVFSYHPLADAAAVAAIQLGGARPRNAAFAIGESAQAIVTIVESSNQEEEASRIARVVGGTGGAGAAGTGVGRQMERILNIIDMNIVPIDVHALMRAIPLANLFNYEYTFEQMVAAIYGEQAKFYTNPTGRDYITDANTVNSRQMYLRLLVNPYLNLDAGGAAQGQMLYGSDVMSLGTAGFVHRIFRGDNGLGMGRPKFLSDQLFNKALFGSVYQRRMDFDEGGPDVGAGIARGRQNVGVPQGPAPGLAAVPAGVPAQRQRAWVPIGGPRGRTITYLRVPAENQGPESAVVEAELSSAQQRAQLEAIGRRRFDTRVVRNLFFITNVLRLVRLKLNRELTQTRSVLVSSHSAVASGLTEYGTDPYSPNESYDSTFAGMPRFSDQDEPSKFV
jgi:hypothetical protein